MRWTRLGRALPALVLWAAAGCEALIAGRLGDVRCADEGQIGPPACPTGFVCTAGNCVPTALGTLCQVDSDCADGMFCLDAGARGGPSVRRCSRTCCTSSDCNPDIGAVCWIPPDGGGNFCWPAAEVGRTPGGTGAPLSTCVTDGECRSGRCVEEKCVDTCCSDTSCGPGGGVCRLVQPSPPDAPGFWCGAATGALPRYASCAKDSDCASGLCLDFGTKLPMCSSPCCSSAECETADGAPVRCVMLSGANAGVRACGIETGAGNSLVGVTCTTDADCRGGMCLMLEGRLQCSDLCCSDASCGDPATVACRPAIVDSAWALRCEPK